MKRILVAAAILMTFNSLSASAARAFGRAKAQLRTPARAGVQSLSERLGYPRGARLLIVNTDDLGMAHSIDAAAARGFASGLVTSGSVMVPCPWFPEIAAYAVAHPEADLGLHLTLTSEWSLYRWGPVLPRDQVASLLDASGYLHLTEDVAAARISPAEAEAEVRAQIARARAFGIQPTHLDSHMGTLYQTKALFEVLLRVARDNRLPIRVSKEWFTARPFLRSLLNADDVVLDQSLTIGPDVTPERWAQFYLDALGRLPPGVTEIGIHLASDDEEMRHVAFNHPGWGAAWRQRDFDFFTGEAFRRALRENGIKLVTWRELGKLLAAPRQD